MEHRLQKSWHRGLAYFRTGSLEAAQACFESILLRDPGNGPARLRLSMIAARRGRLDDAIAIAEAILVDVPDRSEVLAHLARCQLMVGQPLRAVATAERALRQENLEPVVLDSLAIVFSQASLPERALALFDAAIARQPEQASLYFNRALALRACDRLDDAERDLETCLSLNRQHGKAHWALATLRRPGQAEDRARRAARLQDWLAQRPDVDETPALALFQELDYGGRHAEAWPVLEGVMRRRRQMAPPESTRALFDRLAHPLPASDALELTAPGAPMPVFLIGMPRSGVSLLARLLDRHSEASVHRPNFGKRLRHTLGVNVNRALDVGLLDRALRVDRHELARECREALAGMEPGKRFACDHQPMDFLLFELIASALPEARFLHVSRDPLDTLLSCLAQPNTDGSLPVHDPEELADYVAEQSRLLHRWQRQWPGRLLEVHYDSLVEKPEMVLRVACAFLGLRYESAMRGATPVDTLSHARWLHYATPLEPARLRLEKHGLSG